MIKLVPFSRAHILAYRAWFLDPFSVRYIEKPNEDWLAYVLAGTEGAAWAGLQSERLTSVLQADWGDHKDDAWLSLIVAPGLRGAGIGGATLRAWLADHRSHFTTVSASIETQNQASLLCFQRCGFALGTDDPDEFGQIHLRYRS